MELIWHNEKARDFLEDLKTFAASLDCYHFDIDLTMPDEGKRLSVANGDYVLDPSSNADNFECPECLAALFDVLEGEFDGKPVLGLCCRSCETYGAVFPNGL